MTKDEFEAGYAERSEMTLAELHAMDLHGRPCDCDEDICEGWQMVLSPCGTCDHRRGLHKDDGRCLGESSGCLCQHFIPSVETASP